MIIKECLYKHDDKHDNKLCDYLNIIPISCGKIYDEISEKIIIYLSLQYYNNDIVYLFVTDSNKGIDYYNMLACRDMRAAVRGMLHNWKKYRGIPAYVTYERLLEIANNLINESNNSWKEYQRLKLEEYKSIVRRYHLFQINN